MSVISKKMVYTQFLQRENFTHHHRYDEEMLQYDYIKDGDVRGIELAVSLFSSDLTGKLSDDPLRNTQYLFICSMTLVTRFAIEGGMEPEAAYTASDLYIQNADKCKNIADVTSLHREMVTWFTTQMSNLKKQDIYSKPIIHCLDYIYDHLHSIIRVDELADAVGLNPSYLSTLFKKEVGTSVSEYIRLKRVEACKNMLKYSDYSLTEISEYLAFSSYSHFVFIFRRYTQYTPGEFRKRFFRKTVLAE